MLRQLRRFYKRWSPFWNYHGHYWKTPALERKLFHAHHIFLHHPWPLDVAHPELIAGDEHGSRQTNS